MHSPVKSVVLLPAYYLPNLEYFTLILLADSLCIESHENFQKQTFRNRCYVKTANGIERLTIPLKKNQGKTPIRDVKIDYDQPWMKKQWKCLTSAYANSPYFEFFAADFKNILDRKIPFLFDLNTELLTLCLKILNLPKTVTYNLSYEEIPSNPIYDARSCITDKKNVNTYQFYHPYPYYQTFGNDFSENLSIVDLLFNKGPEALEVLRQSVKDPVPSQ